MWPATLARPHSGYRVRDCHSAALAFGVRYYFELSISLGRSSRIRISYPRRRREPIRSSHSHRSAA
jgi:hypothetical protein